MITDTKFRKTSITEFNYSLSVELSDEQKITVEYKCAPTIVEMTGSDEEYLELFAFMKCSNLISNEIYHYHKKNYKVKA